MTESESVALPLGDAAFYISFASHVECQTRSGTHTILTDISRFVKIFFGIFYIFLFFSSEVAKLVKMLSFFTKNDTVIVSKLCCSAERRLRLEAFGIFEGASVSVLYSDHSKMIVKIGETRLAISKAIADEISVFKKVGDIQPKTSSHS